MHTYKYDYKHPHSSRLKTDIYRRNTSQSLNIWIRRIPVTIPWDLRNWDESILHGTYRGCNYKHRRRNSKHTRLPPCREYLTKLVFCFVGILSQQPISLMSLPHSFVKFFLSVILSAANKAAKDAAGTIINSEALRGGKQRHGVSLCWNMKAKKKKLTFIFLLRPSLLSRGHGLFPRSPPSNRPPSAGSSVVFSSGAVALPFYC